MNERAISFYLKERLSLSSPGDTFNYPTKFLDQRQYCRTAFSAVQAYSTEQLNGPRLVKLAVDANGRNYLGVLRDITPYKQRERKNGGS